CGRLPLVALTMLCCGIRPASPPRTGKTRGSTPTRTAPSPRARQRRRCALRLSAVCALRIFGGGNDLAANTLGPHLALHRHRRSRLCGFFCDPAKRQGGGEARGEAGTTGG